MIEETIFREQFPRGEHRDLLFGPKSNFLWERPWRHNLIVNGLRNLLAALVKGDEQGVPLMYWAVGTGDVLWDAGEVNHPPDAERRIQVQLYNETGRKPIPPEQIEFLDGSLTNRLEIRMDFTVDNILAGDENRQLREFGLFAGGTAALDTGILINHRIHPRIDMQAGFTLQRTLRLTF